MRMPTNVRVQLLDLVNQYGNQPYDWSDLIPEATRIILASVSEKQLAQAHATEILTGIYKTQDSAVGDSFFEYDRQLILGERQRIKRGNAEMPHWEMWSNVQETNFTNQTGAIREVRRLMQRKIRPAFRDQPNGTTTRMLFNPDGSLKNSRRKS